MTRGGCGHRRRAGRACAGGATAFLRHFAARPEHIPMIFLQRPLRGPPHRPSADAEPFRRAPDRTARRWIRLPESVHWSGCLSPAAAASIHRIRQMPVRLNIRQKLFAGMGTACSIHKSAARPSSTTSSIFRTPQAGLAARSWLSKASLLGAVCAPSRL